MGMMVYNGEEFIRTALDSLLAQTYDNFEIIISDNGSTDTSPQIIQEYAARDPRIRYIQQSYNLGLIGNFNFVLEQAQQTEGEYFMWTASDDWWAPTFVEKCVSILEKYPNVISVFCHDFTFSHNGGKIIDKHLPVPAYRTPEQRLATRLLNGENPDLTYGLFRKNMCSKMENIEFNDVLHCNVTAIKGDLFVINEFLFGKGLKDDDNKLHLVTSDKLDISSLWPFFKANCKLVISNFTGRKRLLLLLLALRQTMGLYLTHGGKDSI